MKITLISYYIPPAGGAGAIRWAHLLNTFPEYSELLNETIKFSVITPGHQENPIQDEELLTIVEKRARIISTDSFNPFSYLMKRRKGLNVSGSQLFLLPDNKLWWNKDISRALNKNPKPDLVIVSCPPFSNVFPASKFCKKNNIPFIVDFRDSYLLDPNMRKLPKIHCKIRNWMFFEGIKNVSGIVTVAEPVYKEMLIRTKYNVPVTLIPNGSEHIAPKPLAGRFTISCSGRFFGNLNYPKSMLEAIKILKDEGHDVLLKFIGPADTKLENDIQELSIEDNCEITGAKRHSEVLELLSNSNMLFTFLENDRYLGQNQIASKTWDFLGTGRPIIGIVPKISPAADVINRYNAGFIVNDNPEEIAKLISENINDIHSNITYNNELSWKNRAQQFTKFIAMVLDYYNHKL